MHKVNIMTTQKNNESDKFQFSDIFKEGSDTRQIFARYYSVLAIVVVLTVLVLLALATQG